MLSAAESWPLERNEYIFDNLAFAQLSGTESQETIGGLAQR